MALSPLLADPQMFVPGALVTVFEAAVRQPFHSIWV